MGASVFAPVCALMNPIALEYLIFPLTRVNGSTRICVDAQAVLFATFPLTKVLAPTVTFLAIAFLLVSYPLALVGGAPRVDGYPTPVAVAAGKEALILFPAWFNFAAESVLQAEFPLALVRQIIASV